MEKKFVRKIFPRLYEIYALSDQENENNCLYGLSILNSDNTGNTLYEYSLLSG